MADTSRTVRVRFDGTVTGLSAAARKAERDLDRLRSNVRGFATGLAAAGAGAGLIGPAVGVALPALGSLALGFGVAKLAMSATNKEAEQYKRQLEDMKRPLKDLQNTAGKAFLPGVTDFLKDSKTLFPILDRNVERTGKIMGQTARDLGNLFKTDRFRRDLDSFLKSTEPVTDAIGDSFVKLTGRVIRFGAEMAPAGEGFATFIRDAEAGISGFLDGLAPHAADFKSMWESVGSIVRDVLPLIGEFAGEMSSRLAPILKSVAGFIRENKDAISEWVPFLSQAAIALGGLRVASGVAGWLGGVASGIGAIVDKVRGGGADVDGFGKKLGALKVVGGTAAGLLAIAFAIDEINIKAKGGAENLDGIATNLHQFRDVVQKGLTGDIWFGRVVDQAKAAAMGIKNAFSGFKLTPIELDTSNAQAKADQLMREINGATPMVNINGNTTGAAFAFRRIKEEIAAGKSEIIIDGQPVPAEEALAYVKSLIDTSTGNMTIDGDGMPASNALDHVLNAVESARPQVHIDGDIDPVTGKVRQAVTLADGSKGTITVDGNPNPATGKIQGTIRLADGSKGTVTIDGNQQPANGKINATVTYANGRRAQIQVDANTSAANAAIGGLVRNWNGRNINIYVTTHGTGGIASAGRWATGGPVFGPGSSTSDSVPAMLSAGEHVLTAREVKAMGGHAAVRALRRSLVRGDSPSLTAKAVTAARPAPPPRPVASPSGGVLQLVVSPGTDGAVAAMINHLARIGKLQVKVA